MSPHIRNPCARSKQKAGGEFRALSGSSPGSLDGGGGRAREVGGGKIFPIRLSPYTPWRCPQSIYTRCGEPSRNLRRGGGDSPSTTRTAPHNQTDDQSDVALVVLPDTYLVLLLSTTATPH
jgi:hypothetical protein